MSRQINNFCGPDTDFADRLIAVEVHHPGRQLVVAIRRTSTTRTSPASRPRSRRSTTSRSPTAASPTSARTGPGVDILEEVRSGDHVLLPSGYHGPSMAAPGYDLYYLNVMAGPGRAGVAVHRRPGPRLDPGHLGRPGDRPAAADVSGEEARHEAHRRPGARPLPGEPVLRARRRRAAADRRLLRHLRPRQRRRRRPGAARGGRRDALRARAQRAGDGPRRRPATRARRTGSPPTRAPPRSAPARRTWSPARRSPPSTGCRCCCCRATSSPRASPTRCCRSSRTRPRSTSRSTTRFKPVSRFWDRINRPEQLISSALAAMRVLTDPAETGAVTLVAAAGRAGRGLRLARGVLRRAASGTCAARRPRPAVLAEAAELLRAARRPLIVSRRRHDLRRGDRRAARARRGHRRPGRRDAGRQGLAALRPPAVARRDRRHRHDRRQRDRPRRRRDPRRRHALERLHHRLALAVRRRTRASSTSTSRASTPFKHAGLPLVADARDGLEALRDALEGWSADADHTERATTLAARVGRDGRGRLHARPRPAARPERGARRRQPRVSGPRDVVVCAAGSMPGDLHKLWRTRDPKGYHVEYGFSCMGYEIAGGLGVKLAAPDREVYVMVGDGSFLMMAQEIVTAVQEGVKLNDRARPEPRLRVDRRAVGVARLAALRHALPRPRRRGPAGRPGRRRGGPRRRRAPRDDARRARGRPARAPSRASPSCRSRPTRSCPRPSSEAWWDVPVAEVSGLDSTRAARETYDENKRTQQQYLNPRERVTP